MDMTYDDIIFDVLNELSINGEEVEGTNDNDTPSADADTSTDDDTDDNDAPPDEPPTDDDTDESTDDDTDDNDVPPDEPPTDDDTEESTDDDTEESTDDDTDDNDVPPDEPPTDDDTDESTDDDTEESTDDDNLNNNIENIEQELFSNLTPEQISIRNTELKNHFIEIYQIIGNVLTRINDISKSEDNVKILEFITEKLLELRNMVDFNITKAYNTRTYIENNIIYQQILSTLNTVIDIISRIPSVNKDIMNFSTDVKNTKDIIGEPIETSENRNQFNNVLNVSDMMTASDYQEENYSASYQSNDFNCLLL